VSRTEYMQVGDFLVVSLSLCVLTLLIWLAIRVSLHPYPYDRLTEIDGMLRVMLGGIVPVR